MQEALQSTQQHSEQQGDDPFRTSRDSHTNGDASPRRTASSDGAEASAEELLAMASELQQAALERQGGSIARHAAAAQVKAEVRAALNDTFPMAGLEQKVRCWLADCWRTAGGLLALLAQGGLTRRPAAAPAATCCWLSAAGLLLPLLAQGGAACHSSTQPAILHRLPPFDTHSHLPSRPHGCQAGAAQRAAPHPAPPSSHQATHLLLLPPARRWP
jgi:hypothetical protein